MDSPFITVIIIFIANQVFVFGVIAYLIKDRRKARLEAERVWAEVFESWRERFQKSEK